MKIKFLDCISDLKLSENKSQDLPSTSEDDSNLEMGKLTFASETAEVERESLDAYKQVTANAKAAPQIVIEPPSANSAGNETEIRHSEEESMKQSFLQWKVLLNFI